MNSDLVDEWIKAFGNDPKMLTTTTISNPFPPIGANGNKVDTVNSIPHHDQYIQGQMVSAQLIAGSHDSISFLDEATYTKSIKRKLIDQIAQYIYDNNLVEFTKAENIMED